MKRSLRFWTRYTWDSCRVVLVVAAVLSLITVVGADRLDWGLFASVIPYFLVVSAALCMVIINYSSQMLYVPLLLSMGETRRRIFFGFHYYRALIIAAAVALCALIWALVPGQVSALGLGTLPVITAVLVLAASVGSVLGTVFCRWKWMATLLFMVIGGTVGGTVSFTMMGGFQMEETAILELAVLWERLPGWLAAVSAAVLALDMAFHWSLLRRQEVKL